MDHFRSILFAYNIKPAPSKDYKISGVEGKGRYRKVTLKTYHTFTRHLKNLKIYGERPEKKSQPSHAKLNESLN